MNRFFSLLAALSVTVVAYGQRSLNSAPANPDSATTATDRGDKFTPGKPWMDVQGEVINAHGGGILVDGGKYYWFGEKRGGRGSQGVNVYSSSDLYHWTFEALALSPSIDTSAYTGWAPNKASLYTSLSIFGPWKHQGNPMRGENADLTFGGQSAYVLSMPGKKGDFIFIADRWNPKDLKDSRYLWLPIEWQDDTVTIPWKDDWDLGFFDK